MLRLVQFHEGKSSTVLLDFLLCFAVILFFLLFFSKKKKKKTSTAMVGVHISQSSNVHPYFLSLFYPHRLYLKYFGSC